MNISLTVLSDSTIKRKLIPEKDAIKAKEWFRDRKWDEINKRILIFPFNENKLRSFSYDLSIGEETYSIRKGEKIENIDIKKEIVIEPGETILILTKEFIGLPRDIAGIVEPRARLIFEGLIMCSTKIDPTWYGKLTIGITNNSKEPLKLKYGESFCSLILLNLDEPFKRVLSPDVVPFLGQDTIIYIPSHVTPWTPKREDTVTKDDLDKAVNFFGPPIDVIRGMFTYLEKRIDKKFSDLWTPAILTKAHSYVDKRTIKLLMSLLIPLAITLCIAILGFLLKTFGII